MQLPGVKAITDKLQAFILSRIPLTRRNYLKQLTGDQTFTTAAIDVAMVHAILDGTDIGNTDEYFALCDHMILSDSHMQGEIAKRKLALLGDQMLIGPVDKKNPDDVRAADAIKEMVDGLPTFLTACAALLDGTLWPLAIVEKVFRRATKNPKLSYEVDKLVRVPPRLFNYNLTGYLRIWDTDPDTGMILSSTSDPDPMRYIIHRGHLLSTPDYRGGPMRSLIFWWLFSIFDRDWWARFMDRYGSPFLVGKYDQADDDSRIILENAFQLASKIGGIVISRQTEVELKEAMAKTAGEAFDLLLKVCQREKSKHIVGQTTSADAEHGGLGSTGVAKEQAQVRGDIRQFDAIWLGNTLQYQLFTPFLQINGIRGRAKIAWGAEEADDINSTTEAVANLSNADLEVTDEGLETLGLRVGLPLQRKKIQTPPAGPGGFGQPKTSKLSASFPGRQWGQHGDPPSSLYDRADAANGSIANSKAAELAQAFRGVFAPVARFILDSSSSEELIGKIETHYAGWSPAKVADIILTALEAQAANGAARYDSKLRQGDAMTGG
jgi:phage gp29-like protein